MLLFEGVNMDDITKREKELLLFIIKFQQVNGFTPTVREMSKGLCMGSRSTIISMLNHLEERGYIEFKKRKERQPYIIKVCKFL